MHCSFLAVSRRHSLSVIDVQSRTGVARSNPASELSKRPSSAGTPNRAATFADRRAGACRTQKRLVPVSASEMAMIRLPIGTARLRAPAGPHQCGRLCRAGAAVGVRTPARARMDRASPAPLPRREIGTRRSTWIGSADSASKAGCLRRMNDGARREPRRPRRDRLSAGPARHPEPEI